MANVIWIIEEYDEERAKIITNNWILLSDRWMSLTGRNLLRSTNVFGVKCPLDLIRKILKWLFSTSFSISWRANVITCSSSVLDVMIRSWIHDVFPDGKISYPQIYARITLAPRELEKNERIWKWNDHDGCGDFRWATLAWISWPRMRSRDPSQQRHLNSKNRTVHCRQLLHQA